MTFTLKYKPLFEVNILHQYFLNKGTKEYSEMVEAEKEKQLAKYNFSNFFTVHATTETLRKIKGHNFVFKPKNMGFALWAKVSALDDSLPFIAVDDTLELTFLLKLNTNTFFSISDLKFESAGKLFFFSNQKISTEASTFPLIKKGGATNGINDNYTLSEVSELIEKEKLTLEEKKNLFGIVRLHMKGKSSGFNITTAQGKIRTPHQVFELNFENRKTFWRYVFNTIQEDESDDLKIEPGNTKCLITRIKQPLCASGFISIKHGGVELPNPDAKNIKPSNTNNKIYSEIYM